MANKVIVHEKLIYVFDSVDDLIEMVVREWYQKANTALEERDRFDIALSGGRTPIPVLQKLVADNLEFDWSRTHVFQVDERFVPIDHADSNYKMLNEHLISRVNIPQDNVHRIKTESADAQLAAHEYAQQLNNHFDYELPRFDLVILGMGPDGHTASLFNVDELIANDEVLVQVTANSKAQHERITLALSVLNNARDIFFLATGTDKSGVLKKVLQDRNMQLPAAHIVPRDGQLVYFLDKDAAEKL
ncbi:MAG: 6-phosphogluconolactonase [Gammaproteobacteria bacterium]|nr:6-phosphogluconolactonase [Gammaproteobacteria bacterium]